MLGPEGAAEHAREWLADRIPARLRVLEARYALPAGSLADPAKVLAHEDGPLGIEDWPAVYVLPQRLEGLTLSDIRPDGSEVYRCVYALRVLAWVRADDHDTTDQLRKRYALAIREALLERKSLTPAATYGSGDYGTAAEDNTVVPSSIREDYSDVFTDQAKRTIAGVFVDVQLVTIETLDGPPALGVVGEVDVRETADTATIPPHPAL